MFIEYTVLDDLDLIILEKLQEQGRISNAELSRQLNLSQPAVHNRIKRLEREGYIQKYVAVLDRELIGYDLLCFVHISIQLHQFHQIEAFRETIRRMPQVLECHHVTGEFDYLLKVITRNRKDLEHFVINELTPIPGVARIQTSLVFREVKSTTAYPLE
ncbi:MAG: Lrp/AsnC family transcriptional regulator [Anaerolineaceae bacterium]|nr:Lrp/AsnC family transcriptional regulator [Anaerolineaceae bacterium]